jgi:AcrR family transcriptional regulator
MLGMGSGKVTPSKPASESAVADADEQSRRPSSNMTREIEAVTAKELIASSMRIGSAPKVTAAPLTGSVDLAQTQEAPTTPQISILDAADALIADVGFATVTEAEIATAANVSIDDLRQHFPDKHALLRALNERFCAQAIGVTDDATHSGIWDHATPHDVIEVAVRSILDVVLGRAALVRAVLTSGDPDLVDGFRRVGANMTARISRVIDQLQAQHKPDQSDVAFAFLIAVSLAHHEIMVGTEWSGVTFLREELYERASRSIRAYLEARPRPS